MERKNVSCAHTLYGSNRALLSPIAAKFFDRGVLKWVIAMTAALGAILEIIDTSIVNVAIPDIQGNLGTTLSTVGWISTGYACANVVMIPLTAWLSDRFGRKAYLTFSLVGFTVSSVLCGMANNLGMLVFARVLQGLFGGGLLAKAQSILFETFPRKEQPAAQAVFGIGVIAGPAFGPILGGYLTDTLDWRWIFFINIPAGLLAVFMTMIFFPRDEKSQHRHQNVDWVGIGFLAIALASFQIVLEEGQKKDWFASDFIRLMAASAAVGLALFIWREFTTEHPVVDLRVLRYRSLTAGSAYSLVLGIGLYGVMFAVPIFVRNYLHFTAMQSGLLLMPGAIGSALMMILLGKISGKFDARLLITMGALMMMSSAFFLSKINPNTGTAMFFWPLIFRGFGAVMMFLPLSLATLGPLPRKEVSSGSGFYNLTRQMGSSIGIALIATLLAHREAVHRAVLVENINPYSPIIQQRLDLFKTAFMKHTADPVLAQNQAIAAIGCSVNSQAMLLSFADVFLYVAVVFVITLPLLFLLGKGNNREATTTYRPFQ